MLKGFFRWEGGSKILPLIPDLSGNTKIFLYVWFFINHFQLLIFFTHISMQPSGLSIKLPDEFVWSFCHTSFLIGNHFRTDLQLLPESCFFAPPLGDVREIFPTGNVALIFNYQLMALFNGILSFDF